MDPTGHLDLLDRQTEFLRRTEDDREFLVALPTLLVQLYGDIVIRDVLIQLDADASATIADYKRLARSIKSDLQGVAEDFASRARSHQQQIDDARIMIHNLVELQNGMLPLDPSESFDLPLDRPLQQLEEVRLTLAEAPGFLPIGQRLVQIYETHNHAKRSMILRIWTEGNFALVRLRSLAELVNPKPEPSPGSDEYPRAISLGGVIDRYLFGPQQSNMIKADESIIAEVTSRARIDCERLLLELRRRLTVGRSRLAVLRRFQTWAQWYARDELRTIIEKSGASKKRKKIEEDLTLELARFLFREGLDPLSQPLLGRVKPDLLDPSERGRLYVEAKWVASASEALDAVAQGVRQTLDSAITLVGTAHRLEEAFVVLFLGGGSRVDAPAQIAFAELTIRIAVVDLAPWEKVASRRTEPPLILTEDALVQTVENLLSSPAED